MNPSKKAKEAFQRDKKAVMQVNHCLAASMLLRSIARTYEREASDVLRRNRLQIGEAQALASTSDNAYNTYLHCMESLRFDKKNDTFLRDYDAVFKIVEEHMPDIIKEIIKYIE